MLTNSHLLPLIIAPRMAMGVSHMVWVKREAFNRSHPPVSDCVIGMCFSILLTFPFCKVNPSHADSSTQKCTVLPDPLSFRGSRVGILRVSTVAPKDFCWQLGVSSWLNEMETPWTQELGSCEDPALNVQVWGVVSFRKKHRLLKDLCSVQP